MPLYTWRDETSGKHVDIIRKFDNHDEPPTRDDISGSEMTDDEVAAARWIKVLNSPDFVRMPGWQGRKGFWIQLFMVGALWTLQSLPVA